jgi:hypothetical protein
MKTIQRVLAITLALGALALGAGPTAAHDPDPFTSDPWPQNDVLTWRWGAGGSPPAAIRDAIRAAVDDANTTHRSKAPTFDQDSGATSTITYGEDVPCGENGLGCYRRNAPAWFTIHLRENGHRFDWGTLRWCEATGRPNGCYDAENITLDELGHVLGLYHHENRADDSDYSDAVVQTYSRVKPQAGYNAHVFGRCDVAALQQGYDVASTTTLYSTCLDVPTDLAIAASRTSVAYNGSVTFTATLRSDGSGRLSNNLPSGRTVVLQRRTSSGWTDVATMSPGSSNGTYTASLAMRSTGELRALFRRPSNEGLRGSSSPSVTVTVTGCTVAPCPLAAPGAAG